jgi:hypothetical protein
MTHIKVSGNSFRIFEAPRSKLRGIFDRSEYRLFLIRSLTPQQATGIALAISVQRCFLPFSWEKGVKDSRIQGFKCLLPIFYSI